MRRGELPEKNLVVLGRSSSPRTAKTHAGKNKASGYVKELLLN
jgi:hypothetical protein